MKYKWEVCTLVSINLDYNKNKLYKTLDCWSRDMPNFAFLEKNPLLEKDLENILLTIFQEKYFSCSINWPNFNVWLPLLLEILGNMCIAMAPGCDIINFEINLIFLIKLFFYMNKNSRKKLNILRTKIAFKVEEKAYFVIFIGLSFVKYCLRSESATWIEVEGCLGSYLYQLPKISTRSTITNTVICWDLI